MTRSRVAAFEQTLTNSLSRDNQVRNHRTFAVVVIALAAMGVALFLSARILVEQFDTIELDQAADKARQASRALEADLNQLAVSTRDYAEWDDAQSFIVDRDREFLRANFSFASLDGMQVDHMAIVDSAGAILYAANIDESRQVLVEGLGPDIISVLDSVLPHKDELRSTSSVRRIVRIEKGLLAFCVVEITRSDHSGKTGAVLFFARDIASDEIARVRQTSQLPVEFIETSPQRPADTRTSTIDGDNVTGIAVVRDWRGQAVAELRVTTKRDIGSVGRRTTAILMSAIALLALACCGLFLFMMQRQKKHWVQQLALQATHERILSHLDESIVLIDPATMRLMHANAAFLSTLGYSSSELSSHGCKDVFMNIDERTFKAAGTDAMGLHDCRMQAKDGRVVECEINITRLADQEPQLICVIARDLTQRRLTEQKLRENQAQLTHLAEHDSLTGLPNRNYLQMRLGEILERTANDARSLALFYIDIDHFKHINDIRGHQFGDALLKVIAKRLRDSISAEDIVLRMGGDEFVVVSVFADGLPNVRTTAQALLSTINGALVVEDTPISVTASIGGAVYPQDGLDLDTLLKNADIALYQAKENGRNCFNAFTSDMNAQLSQHVALEQALRQAIDTEQIQVAYQPVVDLNTGLLVSLEALARWNHPDMGAISPGQFIPVAERSGLIVALGERIIRDVIAQLREWRDAGLTLAPVAINVSPLQFERTDLPTYVQEVLLEYDIDPPYVAFEVTESAWLKDSNKHVVAIDTLRHCGSRIYIDDFGTGFSNLGYLKTLPIDAVKIDQSFVRAIETDANDATIVSSIVSVARQLRLDTVAEGIETQPQAERLRELGCRYGQGYYFSKPMPAAQCRSLLEQLTGVRSLTQTVTMRAFRKVGS